MTQNNSPCNSQQSTFSSPSQQFSGILSFFLPFTKNLPSIRHPNSFIFIWQQLICSLVLLANLSMQLIGCPWFPNSLHIKLCITWSVFVDVDSHKRWPTSRHFVGTEIQRDCNFEAQVYHFGFFSHFIYSIDLWCSLLVTPSCLLISVASYTEIFRALSHRQAQIQDYGQQQSTNRMLWTWRATERQWTMLCGCS